MKDFSFPQVLRQRLLPAISFDVAEDAVPVAETLLAAGLAVMEIPLRTPAALAAITAIRNRFPELTVGAGTLLTPTQVQQAIDAGAEFGLSPGFNPRVAKAAQEAGWPFIPGVMTPSEIELAHELGFSILKVFPIEQLGGPAFLKALQGPYGHLGLQYIPMGGVGPANAAAYAQLPDVLALGGSWLATRELIRNKDYQQIQQHITQAFTLISTNPH